MTQLTDEEMEVVRVALAQAAQYYKEFVERVDSVALPHDEKLTIEQRLERIHKLLKKIEEGK